MYGEIFYTQHKGRVPSRMWRKYCNHVRPQRPFGYLPPSPEVTPGPIWHIVPQGVDYVTVSQNVHTSWGEFGDLARNGGRFGRMSPGTALN